MYGRSASAEVVSPAARRQRLDSSASVASCIDDCSNALINDPVPSRIAGLYQQGSARIRFPRVPAGPLHAVLLNTAGGLTGGDHIRWQAEADTGSRLTMSTAACEKIYRTHGPLARQETRLKVKANAQLQWLPQETIIFDGSALDRTLHADIDINGSALIAESIVLGRQAMSESVESLHLHDRWRIYRGGKLLHAEDLRMVWNNRQLALQEGIMHHCSALSTVVLINNESAEALALRVSHVRKLSSGNNQHQIVAVSSLEHRIVIRVIASNSFYLRKFLIPCIELLSNGSPIPTVWNV